MGTPSVNDTTDREIAPESMQFGHAFPCILQEIWEADPYQVPIRVSNLGVIDSYHNGTLRTSQMGSFTYVIPLAANNNCIIIYIDLVLPMGWVDSPNYFCAFSETLTDVANTLVHKPLPVPGYGAISKTPKKSPPTPPNTPWISSPI